MAIITYEGFENYSSVAAVQSYLNYERTTIGGTVELISTADANGITGRNNGTCLKLTNSLACSVSATSSEAKPVYPRVFLKNPNNATLSSGVFGFAWYARLPAGGGWGNFTPIAVLCDTTGKPHFYVGINSNLTIQVRSYSTTQALAEYGFFPSSLTTWDTHWRADCAECDPLHACGGWLTTSPFSFWNQRMQDIISLNGGWGDQSGQGASLPLLASSGSLITMNTWNYIEIKFVLSTTTTGSIQIKLNRNASDTTLDANVSNIRTTLQSNTNAVGVALGQFWSHNSANTAALHTSGLWQMYYDDYYILNLTGATNNDFLGRVSCKKFSYNNVANYDMTTPANSATALSNFNETFSGTGSISTRNVGNILGQTLDVRSTGVSSETLSPVFVRQYVQGYRTDATSDIGIGMVNGANDVPVTNVGTNSDSINATLKFRDYDNAPDGVEWTNQKIADTTFKHTITQAS